MTRNILYLLAMCALIASCKSPEARKPIKRTSGSFIKESAERNKILYKQEEARIEEHMEANPQHDYLASESGFWYFYNIKDTLTTPTPTPKLGDLVTFTYDIKQLGGPMVLTAEESGLQYYKVDQTNQDLISGLRDGIKLMKQGETVTFLFPSYKAYGYYGLQDKIGTNVPVQSTVTLNSIEQSQEN